MQVTLAGRLVNLRPPTADDTEAIFRACQDAETQRFTPVPVPYEAAHAVAFVKAAEVGWRSGATATFAICDARSNEFDGAIDVRFDGSRGASVGYAVAPWARRRGFATDALRLVCKWSFDERHVERVDWEAVVGNWGSRRAAEAVGFRIEGECRRCIVLRDSRFDGWRAGLLPPDLQQPAE